MRQNEVTIGMQARVKVGGRLAVVTVLRALPGRGRLRYECRTADTGRLIRPTAARLRPTVETRPPNEETTMPGFQIECPEIDSALGGEVFPTREQAECVAEWVHDMECFCGYEIVAVEAEPTTTADEWLTCSGHPGYPGPCPEGMDWGDWLAMNNVD